MAPEYFDNRTRQVLPIDVKSCPPIEKHFGGEGPVPVFGKCRYRLTETPQFFSEHLYGHQRLKKRVVGGKGA